MALQTSKKTVFLHIPKTAGTTLTSIINRNYQKAEIKQLYNPETFSEDLKHGLDSEPIKMLFGHFAFDDALKDAGAYIFTFLRDPISRTVSNYIHLKNSPIQQHKKWLVGVNSFTDFLKQKQAFNWQARHLSGQKFHADFGRDLNKSLEMAKENLLAMNFVGLTERFDDSLLCLSHDLGWNKLKYKKQNVQRKELESNELREKFSAQIAEQNRLDLELYAMAETLFNDKINSIRATDRFAYSLKKLI